MLTSNNSINSIYVRIFFKNEKKNDIIKIFKISDIDETKLKEKISLSFPGYPTKNTQLFSLNMISETNTVLESFFKDKNISKIGNFFYSLQINIFKKQEHEKNKIDFFSKFFKNHQPRRSFLFSEKDFMKNISFFSIIKNFNNPYELYRFEEFMKLNFEKFKKEKYSFKNQKTLEKNLFLIQNLTIVFENLKKFNFFALKIISFNSIFCFLFFVFLKKYNYIEKIGLLIFVWNCFFLFLFFKIIKILINLLNINLFHKNIIIILNNFKFLSSIFQQMKIFLSGAIRTLNIFVN
jgi:hypothetical protein